MSVAARFRFDGRAQTTGAIEVSFEASAGLEGSIYARDVSRSVDPVR